MEREEIGKMMVLISARRLRFDAEFGGTSGAQMTSQPGKKNEQVQKMKRVPGAEMRLSVPHMKHGKASLCSAKAWRPKSLKTRPKSLSHVSSESVRKV